MSTVSDNIELQQSRGEFGYWGTEEEEPAMAYPDRRPVYS